MSKVQNIGIYVGPRDLDIAAWYNMLEQNGMSRARWTKGLLCAYAMGQKIPIGTICSDYTELSSHVMLNTKGRPDYGWHVRGPNREFIRGSVINISISRAEILPVVEETWSNGHKLASFVKSLIRENLIYGDTNIPPSENDLNKICSAFLIQQNSVPLGNTQPARNHAHNSPRRSSTKAGPAPAAAAAAQPAPAPAPTPASPPSPEPAPENSVPSFCFSDDSDSASQKPIFEDFLNM